MSCTDADADFAAGGGVRGKAVAHGGRSYGSCQLAAAGGATVHPRVRQLLAVKHTVLAAWVLSAIVALPFAISVFDQLNFEPTPLRGSQLAFAADLVRRDFPGLAHAMPLVVTISCTQPCENVVDDETFRGVWELSKLYQELNTTQPGTVVAWDSPSSLKELADAVRLGLSPTGSPRVSEDGQVLLSLSLWLLPEEGQDRLMEYIRRVRHLAAVLSDPSASKGLTPSRRFTVLGMPALKDAFKQHSESEFFTKDVFMIPLTLGVFVYQVRSWRLALLVAASIALSLSLALGAVTFVAHRGVRFNFMTPAMMAAVCVAMSVDYALFILSRFREEKQTGQGIEVALSNAVVKGGSVVSISGTILIGCYVACLLFPGDMIFSLAIGNLLVLIMCILASLTFIPCAIASFPKLFGESDDSAEDTPAIDSRPALASRIDTSTVWFKFGVCITRWPWPAVIPLLIFTCMAPTVLSLTSFRTSDEARDMIPHGDLFESYEVLQKSFPGSDASPILLRLSAGGQNGVSSDSFFADACGVVRHLVNATKGTSYRLRAEDFQSIALLPRSVGKFLPGACPELICLRWSRPPAECPVAPSAEALLALSRRPPPLGIAGAAAFEAYGDLWRSLVSADGAASLVVLQSSIELQGDARRSLVALLRSVLPGEAVYWKDAVDVDMKQADYARLPTVMVASLLFMSVLTSYQFQAAFLPLQLLLTVLIPSLFVFGLLLSIFDSGMLDRLHIRNIDSSLGLHWSVPILVAPVLLGLAVDYDLFLFARVYEMRSKGLDDRAAVVAAVAATGPIINGAGLVMAFAFGSLLLSSTRLNCEIGFALCSGVLLDTFVVRPMLVPSILMIGGRWNYWPQKMPQASLSIENLDAAAALDARLPPRTPAAALLEP